MTLGLHTIFHVESTIRRTSRPWYSHGAPLRPRSIEALNCAAPLSPCWVIRPMLRTRLAASSCRYAVRSAAVTAVGSPVVKEAAGRGGRAGLWLARQRPELTAGRAVPAAGLPGRREPGPAAQPAARWAPRPDPKAAAAATQAARRPAARRPTRTAGQHRRTEPARTADATRTAGAMTTAGRPLRSPRAAASRCFPRESRRPGPSSRGDQLRPRALRPAGTLRPGVSGPAGQPGAIPPAALAALRRPAGRPRPHPPTRWPTARCGRWPPQPACRRRNSRRAAARRRVVPAAARAAPQRAIRAYGCVPSFANRLPSPPQGTFNLPGSIPLRQVMTLVVGPLAAGQSELDLGLPVLEVQRQRHQRQPALRGGAGQLVDLLPVHQQLTGTARLMVGPCALRVLGNVHAE